MIEGKKISKKFGNQVLLENFNFKIETGDWVCFSGASGKGKTTLLNIIGLIEPFESGELLIDGVKISSNKDKLNYFRTKVGFLFQNFALVDNKTVEQNLKMVHKNNRTNYTITEAIDKVGLREKLKSKVFTLSGGEQQRIALARLFLKKCQIILADEPTGSLDKENAQKIMKILQDLNDEGKTIVIVTHDEEIKKKAKRLIEL